MECNIERFEGTSLLKFVLHVKRKKEKGKIAFFTLLFFSDKMLCFFRSTRIAVNREELKRRTKLAEISLNFRMHRERD